MWAVYCTTFCCKQWRLNAERDLMKIENKYDGDMTEMTVFIKELCNVVKDALKPIIEIGKITK